jgi:hypothetical protein
MTASSFEATEHPKHYGRRAANANNLGFAALFVPSRRFKVTGDRAEAASIGPTGAHLA